MARSILFDFLDAAQKIDRASTAQEIMRNLFACIDSYGFTACLITRLPLPYVQNWHEDILLNGWPQEWFAHYNARGHYRDDPCAERSRRTAEPFRWSSLDLGSMSSPAKAVMREAGEFRLREGICVPIHTPFAPPSVVTLAGEFADSTPFAMHVVGTAAWHAFHALLRLEGGNDDEGPLLSEREREVLQWVGAGKTAWEISRILGISSYTVNIHLRNVRQKLGAANIAHSVVEALRRQEIQL
jgi:LuxR family quorum sensing-dependent transcriptional regulator